MTSRAEEVDYANLSQVLGFFGDQLLKELNVCIPGIIEEYDADNKRARVRPAIRTRFTDGSHESKLPLVDVPVLHPSGGGYVLHFPVQAGDGVLLVVSQRGISRWKRIYEESDPDIDSFFSLRDAVAIPGFGARAINAWPQNDRVSLQTEDRQATIYIRVDGQISIISDNNQVRIRGNTEIDLNAPLTQIHGDVEIAGTLTLAGINMNEHVHGGILVGGSDTQGPKN